MSLSTASTPVPPHAGCLPRAEDLAAWNRDLNKTHAMAQMRARAGRVVNQIEGRRRGLVADRVRRIGAGIVADVGCEDGWIAEAYADDVAQLFLCDLDPSVLEGSALLERRHVRAVACDALAPAPLRRLLPESAPGVCGADVIVLSALLEHLPEPRRALEALAPLLAPGGRFVVYLPADGPILLAKRILKRTRLGGLIRGLSLDPAPGHLHVFTRRDVVSLLRPHGHIEEITFDPLCLGYIAVVRVRTPSAGRRPCDERGT